MTTTPTRAAARPAPSGPLAGALTHRQIMVVLSGLLLGMFLASLDQTIVATAIKTIADQLDGQTQQAWVTTAYLITSTITTPLYGKLSDSYGRKPFYLFSIGIFIAGSMLCGTAGSIYQLAGYRAVQGIGAGGLLSLAFAIVGDVVPPRERGRYQAYFMSVFATSSVLGPVLGGALAGQASILGITGWRWIFYVNVPIGLAALVVVSSKLHLPRHRSPHRIDAGGAGLLTLATVPLLLLAEKGREWGWGSGLSLGMIATGVIALVLFVLWEKRMGEAAILPLRVFRSSVFRVASAVSLIVGAGMFGGLVGLPLYLQIVKAESPTASGLLLTPLMVGIITMSGISGQVIRRTGRYKKLPVAGTLLMTAALGLFATLTVDTPLWQVALYEVVMGAGLGMTMQTLVIAVQNALPPREMGVATSSVTFFRSMGGTLGAAVALAVLFSSVIGHIKDRALSAGLPRAAVDRFSGAGSLNDTSRIGTLPASIRRIVLEGFADAMDTTFLTVAVIMALGFVLALFIREVPLRDTAGIAAAQGEGRQAERAEVGTTRTETAVL